MADSRTDWLSWLDAPPRDSHRDSRSRFFVRAWASAASAGVLTGIFYAAAGIWTQALAALVFVISGAVLLALHRRHRTERVFLWLCHLSLAVVTANLAVSTLGQHPADYTNLGLMIVVPLTASFLVGERVARWWLAAIVVVGGVVIVLMDQGWSFPFQDPMPTPSHLMNFTLCVIIIALFARMFVRSAERSLAELKAADAARRAFLANVSHEIRTPMNGVLGLAEVMLLETRDERQLEQLTLIQRSGRTLVSLIDDLLDVSKMEAGRFQLDVADFDLRRLMADVESLWRSHADRKGLQFRARVDPSLGAEKLLVRGDGRRLGQVLNNLVGNALKFTERGEVALTLSREGERYRFVVRDTGIGIEAGAVAKLFTTFGQVDGASTRRYGGTGLGLALSQQLVGLMGGVITLDSEPGVGSVFSFSLLLPEGTPLPTERQVDGVAAAARKVLVVDDNPINLRVAVELVRKLGCTAASAANGREALERCDAERFDIVLMDCHMPEMDGFEATEKLRARGQTSAVTRVVALTASAMEEDREACLRAGMDEVLIKPLSLRALENVLRR
ncbi:MAG: response regulator [Myxococcaceae bacterium]